ncbi:hypothetical protein EYF80_029353 [Liparis tanakae]|uniref:Uncharacterized protein n=1 Tax=Liparis tanakae TaxID=230148 RepID=A0A4Z2H6J4_9TELE|nr:hypothetical protein EYF80_029353 [Liparis tanakae]
MTPPRLSKANFALSETLWRCGCWSADGERRLVRGTHYECSDGSQRSRGTPTSEHPVHRSQYRSHENKTVRPRSGAAMEPAARS